MTTDQLNCALEHLNTVLHDLDRASFRDEVRQRRHIFILIVACGAMTVASQFDPLAPRLMLFCLLLLGVLTLTRHMKEPRPPGAYSATKRALEALPPRAAERLRALTTDAPDGNSWEPLLSLRAELATDFSSRRHGHPEPPRQPDASA